ncbi:MAG TPA: endonuclease III [Gemmatimonadales bacterium]|nr:endonuclease III [Gemmatimonadales bacterium]
MKRASRPKLASAKGRAPQILARLKEAYPEARTALNFEDPYQLMVATILSAQCTDARVNMVTPEVFRRFPDPAAMARAKKPVLERLIQSTGFFRNKAKNLIGMAQAVVADHDGKIPNTMEELHALPGVGRKTANVVLGNAFGINVGVTVDTHVARLSQRLRLTRHDDPVKIERDLMPLFPQTDWALLSHLLIFHGRQVCIARRPRCEVCVIADLCPSARIP